MTGRMSMWEQVERAIAAINNPPKPARPSEASPDGLRRFPNLPCDTDGCPGDLGHEGECEGGAS